MSYETADLGCLACLHTYVDTIERSKRDEMIDCPACQGVSTVGRMLSAPNVRTSDSASYVDGTRKWSKLRDQAAQSKEIRAQKDNAKRSKLVETK